MGILKFLRDSTPYLKEKQKQQFLDGTARLDGYTESPFAHYENSTDQEKEEEYFMQWVFPQKLHRISLRTATGFRLTYKYGEDVWNNHLRTWIPNEEDETKELNELLHPYLESRKWFKEMEKLTSFKVEQGESGLLLYFKDGGEIENFKNPMSYDDEILQVEAINSIDYYVKGFNKYGEPDMFAMLVKDNNVGFGYHYVDVHPSRFIRYVSPNIEWRERGYSQIAAVYDAINVLSTILKATGEAAYRWGTGHPVIFTKDLIDDADFERLKEKIGTFTRRSVHMLPTEYVDRIDLMGQAGSMLNLKALADICLDQVIIGFGMPRPILLGEVAGVVSGSEVNERSYFSLLDREHTELGPVVREYFRRDVNIRNFFKKVNLTINPEFPEKSDYYELDWGIREVLNKMDEIGYRQKEISNTLALTQILTVEECRKELGYKPLDGENKEYNDVVLGLLPFYEMEFQMNMRMLDALTFQQNATNNDNPENNSTGGEPQTNTNYKEANKSTEKMKNSTQKDQEKNKKGTTPKMDSEEDREELIKLGREKLAKSWKSLMRYDSIANFCRDNGIYEKTFTKLYDNLQKLIITQKGE